jgi:hypothetical protein
MRSAAHRWRVIGLAAIASIVSAPALAQFATPDAVVRELYAFYGVGQNQKSGFPTDPATLKRFFDQRLLQEWNRAHRRANDEPTLGYDYFIQGQDWALTPVKISGRAATSDKATVRAEFKNMGKTVVVDYDMARSPEGWRIEDARAKGDASLRQRLKTSGL